ncbi:hypothetical protein AAG570_005102, partial [Ranatra chinensis]
QRAENPLDALLDELQTFSRAGSGGQPGATGTLRRLHSYPEAKPAPPPRNNPPPAPPPRTSSKSPPPPPPTSAGDDPPSSSSQQPSRQELLEQKHRELLRKQRQLQEQYTRLQQLQRAPPPDLLQLKKTGSESNLLGKMGLALAPANITGGSLSHLASTTVSTTATTTTTTSKIYETDIL